MDKTVDNRGPRLVAVCSTFVAMAFVSVVLRMWVRLQIVRAFGWDDAWMLFAMLTYIMFATCAIDGVHWGTGQHMYELDSEHNFKAMRWWWLCYIAYCATMISVKISVGIFLLRVTVRPLHRWIIYIAMGVSTFAGFAFFFVTVFQCTPVSYFWDRFQGGQGSCINIMVIIGLTFLYSAVSAITDSIFGVLPIFLVWSLNMSKNAKLMLIPILSMACVASLAVIVRMAFVMDFRKPDFLYETVNIAIWSDIEQGLAITAGSLATLRPLYRMISARLGLSNSASNGKATGKESADWYRQQVSKQKRGGPFNLKNFTRNEKTGHDGASEEYTLGNFPPIPLHDDESFEKLPSRSYTTWKVQGGGSDSKEDLRTASAHGITRRTDTVIH